MQKSDSAEKILIPSGLTEKLLVWYDIAKRDLPWRGVPDAYKVWVSEIMLQQTRVETVRDYYTRFLDAFPTVFDLAAAPEEKLMKLWQGLGYYSRARNMAKAAKVVVGQFNGIFPSDFALLRSLPGVGEYTAGAISSIAFHLPVPAVDGNVVRVLSRILGHGEDTPDFRMVLKNALIPIYPQGKRCSDFTQSLMELGATVCVPNGAPMCLLCPLQKMCFASKNDCADSLPRKQEKPNRKIIEMTVLIAECGDSIALRKRPSSGLLAGLWELPHFEGRLSENELKDALRGIGIPVKNLTRTRMKKHIFTHLEWHMTPWHFSCDAKTLSPDWVLADRTDLETAYPLPVAFSKLLQ